MNEIWVAQLDEQTQDDLRTLINQDIKDMEIYSEEEIPELVESGMESKVSDLKEQEIANPDIKKTLEDGYLNFIKKEISNYKMEEFQLTEEQAISDIEDLNENSIIPLAFTEIGDDVEFNVQATLNLEDLRLEREIYNEFVYELETDNYDSLYDVAVSSQLLNFSDLIYPDLDIDELSKESNEIKNKKKIDNQNDMDL